MSNKSPHGLVGIMVCIKSAVPPFSESHFYRRLCILGRRYGLTVFVFSPLWIDWKAGNVGGYTYDENGKRWFKQSFPFPQIIYDRCFYENRHQYKRFGPQVSRLRKMKTISFLGNGLRGKWDVLETLKNDPEISLHIPSTAIFTDQQTLKIWLKRYEKILLKPHSGSQGKGIFKIEQLPQGIYHVSGRSRKNAPFEMQFGDFPALVEWIRDFTFGSKYLIQPFLPLTAASGEVYDIRALMQKNRDGLWQLTGMAVRIGKPGSITSNLHGGGHADVVEAFLQNEFGRTVSQQILSKIGSLSRAIPQTLEKRYGRLAELGVDLGIDRSSFVWILEANSKPGRQVFAQIKNKDARQASILNPIYYARFLIDRHLGG